MASLQYRAIILSTGLALTHVFAREIIQNSSVESQKPKDSTLKELIIRAYRWVGSFSEIMVVYHSETDRVSLRYLQQPLKEYSLVEFNTSGMVPMIDDGTRLPLVTLLISKNRTDIRRSLKQIEVLYRSLRTGPSAVQFFIVCLEQYSSLLWKTAIETELAENLAEIQLSSNIYVLRATTNGIEIWEFYSVRQTAYVFQRLDVTSFCDLVRSSVVGRKNLKNITLKALVEKREPLPTTIDFKSINNSKFIAGGPAIEIQELLSQKLNFSVIFVDGKGWIYSVNGTPSGMGQQLLQHEGDFVIALCEMMTFRHYELVSSHPVLATTLHAFFKRPHQSAFLNVLVEAFKPKLWLALGVIFAITYMCFHLMRFVEQKFVGNAPKSLNGGLDGSIPLLFSTIAALCQQGWKYKTSFTPLQIVALVTLVSSMLYYITYSSCLVSMFSVEINFLRTMEDLLHRGFTPYGNHYSERGLEQVEKVADSDGVSHKSRQLEFADAIRMLNDTPSTLLTTQQAFTRVVIRTLNYTRSKLCPWLSSKPLPAANQFLAIYYRKFDPIKKIFNVELTCWRERGILFRQNKYYNAKHGFRCDPPRGIEAIKSLQNSDVSAAYAILITGLLGSILSLLAEDILRRSRNAV